MPGRRVAQLRRRIGERTGQIRGQPANVIEDVAPDLPGYNLGDGVGVGAVGAGILTILEDTIGIPFGSTTDIIDVRDEEGDIIYTVNVNSPTENIAQARAVIDSGTGFSSYLTDEFDIEDVEIESQRVLRDTYQVEVRVVP